MSGRPTCLVRSATGRPRLTPTPTDRSGDTLLLYLDQNYLSGIVKRKAAFRELEPALRAAVRSRRSRRPRVRDPSTARRRCTSPPHPPRTRSTSTSIVDVCLRLSPTQGSWPPSPPTSTSSICSDAGREGLRSVRFFRRRVLLTPLLRHAKPPNLFNRRIRQKPWRRALLPTHVQAPRPSTARHHGDRSQAAKAPPRSRSPASSQRSASDGRRLCAQHGRRGVGRAKTSART